MAKYLVNHHRPQVRMSNVVILSPYREQRSKISELLKGAYDEIQVTTVTKSQGNLAFLITHCRRRKAVVSALVWLSIGQFVDNLKITHLSAALHLG